MSLFAQLNGARSSRVFAICVVTIAIFVDLFLYGLVIPILPQILANQAHIDHDRVQINLSGLLAAYNAAVVIGAPVAGYLADKWSNRKIPLIGGLFALAGATVLFMLSETIGLLYVARILQGLSAAIVWAVGLALLVDVVGLEGVGAAMGWTSLGLSLGNTVGPLVGGVVYQQAGRYATFSVAFGAIAVDVVLRLLLKEPKHREAPPVALELDEVAEHGPERNKTAKPNEVIAAGGSQSKIRLPAIIQLLRHRAMLSSLWSVFLATVILTGLEAVIPLHAETTFGWSSQGAGLGFLGIVMPIFLSPVIGMLYDRHGPSLLTMVGFALITVAGPLLAIVRSKSIGLIVVLVILLVFVGIGVSLVMTPQMAEIGIFADKKAETNPGIFGPRGATAQCCALMTVATALAGVVGPLATGSIEWSSGWIATSITIGAVAALGFVSVLANMLYDRNISNI